MGTKLGPCFRGFLHLYWPAWTGKCGTWTSLGHGLAAHGAHLGQLPEPTPETFRSQQQIHSARHQRMYSQLIGKAPTKGATIAQDGQKMPEMDASWEKDGPRWHEGVECRATRAFFPPGQGSKRGPVQMKENIGTVCNDY